MSELGTVFHGWQLQREFFFIRMASAQKACNRELFENSRESLIVETLKQIELIELREEIIRNGTVQQRLQELRLSYELAGERYRLRDLLNELRLYYRYVPCEEESKALRDAFDQACEGLGGGYFYIPGTETCIRYRESGPDTRRVTVDDDEEQQQQEQVDEGQVLRGPQPAAGGGLFGSAVLIDTPSGRSFEYGPFAFDDIRIAVSPSFHWQAPTPRGFMAWENGIDVFAPAFTGSVAHQGFNLGATITDKMSIDRFGPLDMETRINFGVTTGGARGGGFDIDHGRIPGVGVAAGVDLGAGPTQVVSYDFQSQNAYAGVQKMFGGPLAGWSPSQGLDVELSAAIGVRGNVFQQTERSTFQVDPPALALTDIAYDTSFTGAGIGAIAGIKLNAAYDLSASGMFDSLPGDIMLKKALGAYVGYDQYSIAVRDRVNVTGGTTYASENSFNVTAGAPIVRAESEVAIGNSALEFYVKGGIGTAAVPTIGYLREDSVGGVTPVQPKVTLNGTLSYDFSLGLRGNF